MPSKFLEELSNDYEKLFETEIGYDVIIYAGEEPNIQEIHAHSNILCIRSKYFRTAFSNEWAEKQDGKFILKKPNISPHLFDIILRFIYSGNIELKNLQGPDDVLPQDLIHDLLEFHIVPDVKPKTNVPLPRKSNLKPKLDSTIIQSNHIPLFASWIDKKDSSYYNNKNIPYNFKLLYHSGRDRFDAASFYRNCDNKGATIWVAKIQGSTQLIGGYNPLDWNGNYGWKNTRDSFLFNFTDGKNISGAKFGYVKEPSKAIFCGEDQVMQMGFFYCNGNNKWVNNDVNSNYYPDISIPRSFTVESYEVFQVTKK
ncbi:hypothetical protein GLOIN_2v1876131 [Rhizophagus irregularis DAOM 181602=DAOM 197198]|nr:hypothetical protein GLOIN_2v1876131 [Rhizophagus irregularis DAOM 181602=DAOM 197198]